MFPTFTCEKTLGAIEFRFSCGCIALQVRSGVRPKRYCKHHLALLYQAARS